MVMQKVFSEEDQLLISSFRKLISLDVAVPVAAMNSLVECIKRSKSTTWMQLEHELRSATNCLVSSSKSEDLCGRTTISLGSGCELFTKYVTRAFNLEDIQFDACKEELLRRGERFAGMSLSSREHIAEIGHSFVQDSCTVLIHGHSRVVTVLLLKAAETKQFNIIMTTGGMTREQIKEYTDKYISADIPTTVIPDCAIGKFMEQIDLCIVGAEGVMENGGIINKLGTYQIGIVAKTFKIPFYVAVESYKFARMYPLSQRDVSDLCQNDDCSKQKSFNSQFSCISDEVVFDNSIVDFTPSEYITLLFTDLGILTPAAVSDELIRLYQ